MQSQLGQISKKFEEPYTQQFSSGGFFLTDIFWSLKIVNLYCNAMKMFPLIFLLSKPVNIFGAITVCLS